MVLMSCATKERAPRSPQEPILAIVAGDTITLREMQLLLAAGQIPEEQLRRIEGRREALNELIYDRQLKHFVLDRGYDRHASVLRRVRNFMDERLVAKVVRMRIEGPLIPDSLVRMYHDRLGSEFRLQRIRIAHKDLPVRRNTWIPADVSSRSRLEAAHLADSLYRVLLRRPAAFSELAERFSNDEDNKYLDGDLGFRRLETLPMELEDVVLRFPDGRVAPPFETPEGFHIVRVSDRRTVDVGSLEKNRDWILDRLFSRLDVDTRRQAIRLQEALQDSALSARGFRIEEGAVRLFLRRYAGMEDPSGISSSFDSLEAETPLAFYAGGDIRIAEILDQLEDNRTKVHLSLAVMKAGLRRIGRTRTLAVLARDWGFKLSPDDSIQARRASELWAKHAAHRDHVEVKIPVSTDLLRSWYEEHRDDYDSDNAVNLAEIRVPDSARIHYYRQRLEAGEAFERVYKEAEQIPGNLCRITGFMPEKAVLDFAAQLATMKRGDVSKPFRREQGGYAIIKLIDRQIGMKRSFDEVRSLVREHYLRNERKRRVAEWMSQLGEVYPVSIFEENLGEAVF
jgi:parvulin-like peptidyl-prolyl isomerase